MPDSIHTQYLSEIVTRVQALALSGLESAEVKARNEAWDEKNSWEGVSAWTLGETYESPFGTPVNAEDTGYKCGVSMCRRKAGSSGANIDRLPLWKRAVRLAFSQKRFTTTAPADCCNILTTVHSLSMQPKGNQPWDKLQHQWDFLLIVFWLREQRNS